MISVAIGGIGAVLFAILLGLLGGRLKTRQKEDWMRKDYNRLLSENMDLKADNMALVNKHEALKIARKNLRDSEDAYKALEAAHNNLKVEHGDVKRNYQEITRDFQKEISDLKRDVQDQKELSSNQTGGQTEERSEWKPSLHPYYATIGNWVHWKTKSGYKSRRPSPVLKTRINKKGIYQVLLTFVTSSGLTQFWCNTGRCQKVEKPTVFDSLSNDDIICLCTKKQDSSKTDEQRADFREKLKGLYVPAACCLKRA